MSYKLNSALMASNLAFSRSIALSPGLFNAYDSAQVGKAIELVPVILQSHKGRGAFLNHYLGKDFDESKPNVVEGDVACLPPECDTMHLAFSVNVTAESAHCNSCELPYLEDILCRTADAYRKAGGYRHLAERYVWRIMNGSIAHRNYIISANKQVSVMFVNGDGEKITTHSRCRDLPTNKFPGIKTLREKIKNVDVLIDAFAQALSTPDGDPLIMQVIFTGTVGYGAEVYPSQVFSENGDTTKTLVSNPLPGGDRQAKMNGAKIGNAIRHIDEWYADSDGAIAVEAYGFVQHSLSAMRKAQGNNLYNLLWQDSLNYPATLTACKSAGDIPGDIHYFMAMLIRGGVFAAPKDSTKPAQATTDSATTVSTAADTSARGRKSSRQSGTPVEA